MTFCKPLYGVVVNSVNPDQMLQIAASDQGLHCLLLQQIFRHISTACSNFRTRGCIPLDNGGGVGD